MVVDLFSYFAVTHGFAVAWLARRCSPIGHRVSSSGGLGDGMAPRVQIRGVHEVLTKNKALIRVSF